MRVGIVTSFPDASGARKSGIAYYARTVLEPLEGGADEFVVFADLEERGKASIEQRASNVLVRRCWRFGYVAPLRILAAVLEERLDVLHVEYDVYLYGGVVAAFILPLVLRFIRVTRKIPVTTTLHGVVALDVVTPSMLRENGFVLPFSAIGRWGFTAVYALFNWASTRIVVLELGLARTLVRDYGVPEEKLRVVPIPLMHECARPTRDDARRRRGIGSGKLVLSFGYASRYKGYDVLFGAFDELRRLGQCPALHVIASRHPRRCGDPRYEDFYASVRDRARALGAGFDDFVPEDELRDMLAAADVIVLPYTSTYGASAVLGTAIAARRPVLVSSLVRFEGALPCQVFEPDARSCARSIAQFFAENEAALNARTEDLARSRGAGVIARTLQDVRCGSR